MTNVEIIMIRFKFNTGSTSTRVLAGVFLGITTVATVYTVGNFRGGTHNLTSAMAQAASCATCSFSTQVTPFEGHEVISLMAGVTYDFNTFTAATSVQKWTARVGGISAQGVYTAPTFMPPDGEDVVSYQGSDGSMMVITLHIRPNPLLPDSNFPRYLRPLPVNPNSAEGAEYQLIAGASQAVVLQGTLEELAGQFPGAMPILEPGDSYAAPEPTEDCVLLELKTPNTREYMVPEEAIDGASVQQLDTTSVKRLSSDSTIVVNGTAKKVDKDPMKCKQGRRPKHPWPVGKPRTCTGSDTFRVAGPIKKFSALVSPATEGSFEFTTAIKGKIPIKFLPVDGEYQLGVTYPVTRTFVKHTEIQENDVYKCIDGEWNYQGRQICERFGLGLITTPKWFYAIDGYPADGKPGTWVDWTCNMRP